MTTQTSNDINQTLNNITENVKDEMDTATNKFDSHITVHKDPLDEASKYLFKNDVYDLFKVTSHSSIQYYLNKYFNYFKINIQSLTVNLVQRKPNDPIKSMIDQLKDVHQANQLSKSKWASYYC